MAQTRNCLARTGKTNPLQFSNPWPMQRPAPTSEPLAVVLSLSAVVVYVVAGLGLMTFWLWQ